LLGTCTGRLEGGVSNALVHLPAMIVGSLMQRLVSEHRTRV